MKVIRHILDQLGRQGGRAESVASVGWTCTYIPIEIVEAAGLTPARILPEPSSEKADAYLDPNFCPYVRACLGKAMDGEYKGLSGIIVANTCDGMRRLYDAWCHYMPPGAGYRPLSGLWKSILKQRLQRTLCVKPQRR
ncbi:MAG: 2-hydroxyacyl-CoA dehydratase [Deltaproteobacteria bacterium]|nr:2-hydroxyacyl-CoA dehydratase [Deltaproteobacteria bacterium]